MSSIDDKILVLGATGVTGGEVARQMIAAGHKPRLLVRSREKAAEFDGKASIIEGSYRDAAVLAASLAGITKLYLVSGLSVESSSHEIDIINAAKQAGVEHVVKLSVVSADHPEITLARLHAQTEKHLMDSGMKWTMLRPGNFHTNALIMWSQSVKAENRFYQPTANGKWASIDPADIAAVAVLALTQPGHEGKGYTLTGSTLLSATEYAEVCSQVLERPIQFVDVPLSEFRDGMVAVGIAPVYADASMELLECMREDRWVELSTDVKNLLRRDPISFADWLDRNKSAFS